jgi:hypothetical protein
MQRRTRMSSTQMDHIALVVASIEEAVAGLGVSIDLSEIEEFPSEGTRELYVGEPDAPARLLLMQPIGAGPYREALAKRGAGLHHVAFCVPKVSEFSQSLAGSGWLLHPRSIDLLERNRQIWLCRPGIRTLVEVSQATPDYGKPPFITELLVASEPEQRAMIEALDVEGPGVSRSGHARLSFGGREVELTAAGLENRVGR